MLKYLFFQYEFLLRPSRTRSWKQRPKKPVSSLWDEQSSWRDSYLGESHAAYNCQLQENFHADDKGQEKA
jgi:hypothetical protein